jgi:type I restriction enzyme, S subunit
VKPFVPMTYLSTDSMLIEGFEEREGKAGAKFQVGDTLFARITPCLENGKTAFVQHLPNDAAAAFGSTEFIVLRGRAISPEMVYLLARLPAFRDHARKSMTGATGRQRVQERCFESYFMAVPPPTIVERFTSIVRPMFQLVHRLARRNDNLRRTRDLLLPRLMSGELDVSRVPLPDETVVEAPPVAAPRQEPPSGAGKGRKKRAAAETGG